LDVVLLKFSPEGNLVWYKTWGGAKEDNVLDIGIDGGFLYATGKTKSFHPSDKFEAFLLKAKADIGTAVELQPVSELNYFLHPAYPNPFNPSTEIRFQVAENSHAKLAIYTISGRLVRTLASRNYARGEHKVVWNATDNAGKRVASGVYILAMQAHEFLQTRKLILAK
ncbi:MAG: FlgD immunoglobulin-like domain containing protein, partial [bacterium]